MTIDEAIKEFTDWAKDNRKEQNYWAAERNESYDETNPLSYADCEGFERDAEERAEYHEQLVEWLMELKDLRAEQNDQYVFIHELMSELKEAKRLLKAAVEDLRLVRKCQCCKHQITGYADICYGCHVNTNKWKWRYADEALKLIGDEPNGI